MNTQTDDIRQRLARDYDPHFFREDESSERPDMFRQAIEDVRVLLAEIERLNNEVAGYQRWASSVNEALNSGDGSYRP